jgi:hypothetical protein
MVIETSDEPEALRPKVTDSLATIIVRHPSRLRERSDDIDRVSSPRCGSSLRASMANRRSPDAGILAPVGVVSRFDDSNTPSGESGNDTVRVIN